MIELSIAWKHSIECPYCKEHLQYHSKTCPRCHGIGIERITMLKHGIDDIRNFYINDVRFLDQYKEVK